RSPVLGRPVYGYVRAMLAATSVRRLADKRLMALNERNASVLSKSTRCDVVGDKRPNFLASAELSLENFAGHQLTVVHLVRNIYDVAASHQKFFEAGRWTKDFRAAVDQANRSNRLAQALLTGPHRKSFVIVDYDRFWYSAANLRALFRHAQLDETGVKEGRIERFVQIA